MKTLRAIFVLIIFLAGCLAAWFGFRFYQAAQYRNPATGVVITIPQGASLKKISYLLVKERVISRRWAFELAVRWQGAENRLKAGEYEFEEGLKLSEVIEKLREGKIKQYQFTVPEGYSIWQACALLVKKNLITPDVCHQQVRRVDLLKDSFGVETLEGFLFPETYSYDSQTATDEFVPLMVKMFYEKVGEARIERAKEMGLNLFKLLTLASVVEKETGRAEERPLIARVFSNRMTKGMLLQSDPTVIYGIENFDGNLTRAHLEKDTPYNTYTRAGLPAGPICSPGLSAIDAVLDPVPSEFLYFVAKGDGSHYFSATLDEHNAAVRKYQLKQ